MPKIIIKSLPLAESIEIPVLLKRLGKELANRLDIRPEQFVILWEPIFPDHFLYNGDIAAVQNKFTHHPLVDIFALEGMPESFERKLVIHLAKILSRELGVDYNNICVTVNPVLSGKLFVSGDFKESSFKTKH